MLLSVKCRFSYTFTADSSHEEDSYASPLYFQKQEETAKPCGARDVQDHVPG